MDIPFQVRRTGRKSRSISVRVHFDGTVRVGAPNYVGMRDIRKVVAEHASWIRERLQSVRATLPRYESGALHPYLGRSYPLRIRVAEGRPGVELTRRSLQVRVRDDAPAMVRKQLHRFYRDRAEVVLARRLMRIAPTLPWVKKTPELKLRLMRAQWGSCCETGLVTFNTRLVKAPLRLIDYVILHELAHLKHHDHGPGFERLMDGHMPDWRTRRRDLNTLGERVLFD